MAITDHLSGDHHLVSFAAQLTEPNGTLWLAHVEDETSFERFIETISKIPTIETETARESILEQLMKEPRDYVASCREVFPYTFLTFTPTSLALSSSNDWPD